MLKQPFLGLFNGVSAFFIKQQYRFNDGFILYIKLLILL